jgi:hypothetical protein
VRTLATVSTRPAGARRALADIELALVRMRTGHNVVFELASSTTSAGVATPPINAERRRGVGQCIA